MSGLCSSLNPQLEASIFDDLSTSTYVSCLCANHSTVKLIRSGTAGPFNPKGVLCGSVKSVSACPDVSHTVLTFQKHGFHCGKLGCKICMPAQAKKVASRSEKYFNGATILYKKSGHFIRESRHSVWSPPPYRYSQESVEADRGRQFWADYQDFFNSIVRGFYGGASVVHYWRKKHADGSECTFKPKRVNGKLTRCPKGKHYWRWGPHVHYVGYGWFEELPHDHSEYDGWNYKVLLDDKPRSFSATIGYLLTHCGLFLDDQGRQRGQVVRWTGSFSKGKVNKVASHRHSEPKKCPVKGCPNNLHRYGPSSSPDDHGINRNHDQGELMTITETFTYELRPRKPRKPKVKEKLTGWLPKAKTGKASQVLVGPMRPYYSSVVDVQWIFDHPLPDRDLWFLPGRSERAEIVRNPVPGGD